MNASIAASSPDTAHQKKSPQMRGSIFYKACWCLVHWFHRTTDACFSKDWLGISQELESKEVD
jgi:hypothetical protein